MALDPIIPHSAPFVLHLIPPTQQFFFVSGMIFFRALESRQTRANSFVSRRKRGECQRLLGASDDASDDASDEMRLGRLTQTTSHENQEKRGVEEAAA